MISISDIYNQDINFLFGSGASVGLLPTLQLEVLTGQGNARFTLEDLATNFERNNDRRLIPLFMHYYANCIRPAEQLRLANAVTKEPGATVIKNYRTFLLTALEMVKRRNILDRRCNVFTTNYDGCFSLVADELINDGDIDFVLNDGTRGLTQHILQARNFGAYMCQSGIFGRYQSSIPQINLIHLHGSVYWKKLDQSIQVCYDLSDREALLDDTALAALQPFSTALTTPGSTLAVVPEIDISDEKLQQFWSRYEQMPIVNPTKWKFHETVYEEHYYQMLRLLSYELEKQNAVLITFGFSFADEHILNLVMRSLSNPRLQVFVCCFSKAEQAMLAAKFKGHRSVKCLALDDGVMDFTAFNEKVLAWSATSTTTLPMGQPPEAANTFEDLA